MVAISKLIPYKGNPRKISEEAVAKVAESIDAFGFNQPLVVDDKFRICVGHTRLLAAKKLGLKTVPVYQVKMTQSQFKRYNLADNRVGEAAKWDVDLLTEVFADLGEDVEFTGFSEIEISGLLGDEEGLESDEDGDMKGSAYDDDTPPESKMFALLIPTGDFEEFKSQVEKITGHWGLPDEGRAMMKLVKEKIDEIEG